MYPASAQTSKQIAFNNYADCVEHLPRKLARTEKHFFKILKRRSNDPFKMLLRLFDFMDDLFEFIEPYTPCKKGCALCCAIPVSVSELEIELIERTTLIKRNRRSSAILPESRCPFLYKNMCSIYPHRPFVCRRNLTFADTAKWCHIEEGKDVAMPMISFYQIEASYLYIVKKSGLSQFFDIREPFGFKTL